MKVNVGCGKQTWAGFVCVDAVRNPLATRDPDILHAFVFDGSTLTNPLPIPDGVAEEVHAYHFLEHFYRWQAPALVAEFHRLLKDRGKLVLELPNLALAAQNVLDGKGDQMAMWPLYGDPSHEDPMMCHRWGYTPATVAALLGEAGFRKIRHFSPRLHGAKVKRDMRVEAIR